jgi:hypothetical protein
LLDAPLPLASIIEGAAIAGVDFDREISLALEQAKEREAAEVCPLVPQENQNSLVWYFTESLSECLLGAPRLFGLDCCPQKAEKMPICFY